MKKRDKSIIVISLGIIFFVCAIVLLSNKVDLFSTNSNRNGEEQIGTLATKKIKITLNANGGTLSKKSISINKGAKVGVIPTPTRTGYKFKGWYTKKSGGTKVISTTRFDKKTTLYATWESVAQTKVIVTFDTDGGKISKRSVAINKGSAVGTLPTPVKQGYKFVGWYTKRTNGTKVTSKTTFSSDTTIYAVWKLLAKDKIVITFDARGGSVSKKNVTIEKGSAIGELPVPTRTNYIFVGWYTKKTNGTKVTSTTKFSKNGIIYAIWQANDVTSIKLDKTNASIKVGDKLTLKATLSPSNASNKKITWTSSNKTIATVSSSGVVKGVKAGSVTITAKSSNGKIATCKVEVTSNTTPKITLDVTSLTMSTGDNRTLVATVTPSNYANSALTWKSNKPSVATVDNNGKVTAKKAGTATITATLNGKSATCKVTVKAASSLDITKQPIPSGYSLISNASYDSKTLKYNILRKGDNRYALIWVEDAYHQLNCQNVDNKTSGGLDTKYNLFKMVRDANPNKGIVGTNGGFNGRSNPNIHPNGPNGAQFDNIPIIATKGTTYNNPAYSTWFYHEQQHKGVSLKYSVLSISKDSKLINMGFSKKYVDNYGVYTGNAFEKFNATGQAAFEKWYKDNGIRNAWAIVGFSEKGNSKTEIGVSGDQKTLLCQIDEHNYVMATGKFVNIGPTQELETNFNCELIANLDGGGSSTMYYLNSGTQLNRVYENKTDLNRRNVDIIYFIEK